MAKWMETMEGENELFDWIKSKCGVPEAFLKRLDEDDSDWLLIVKLHALIETGLNGALSRHFESEDLTKIFERLETSNPKIGKMAFAKALKILTPESCKFLQRLSELRNHCVHDARNFGFDLSAHLETLGESAKKGWFESLCIELPKEVWICGKASMQKIVMEIPRLGLFLRTMHIMAQLAAHEGRDAAPPQSIPKEL